MQSGGDLITSKIDVYETVGTFADIPKIVEGVPYNPITLARLVSANRQT
jgi:hypothetical protein